MSWAKKIKKPSDLLKTGEMVEAVVLGVNAADRRISLGLKQALGDPWEDAVKKYPIGAVAEGPVTSLTNFGCFVDLGGGIDGMIHISDITREKRLNHPREALAVGTNGARGGAGGGSRTPAHQARHQATGADHGRRIHRRAPGGRIGDRPDRGGWREGAPRWNSAKACSPNAAMPRRNREWIEARPSPPPKPILASLTAMLSAKWKQGPTAASRSERGSAAGQIRTFRILKLDQPNKKIEVELAG